MGTLDPIASYRSQIGTPLDSNQLDSLVEHLQTLQIRYQQLFRSKPKSALLASSHFNLLPLFDLSPVQSELPTSQLGSETREVVSELASYREHLENLPVLLREHLDPEHCWLVGSLVQQALSTQIPSTGPRFPLRLIYFQMTPEEATRRLTQLLQNLEQKYGPQSLQSYQRHAYVLTVADQTWPFYVQLYQHGGQVLNEENISSLALADDGEQIWTTPLGHLTHSLQRNWIQPSSDQLNYSSRLIQEIHRGIPLALPSSIPTSLLQHPIPKTAWSQLLDSWRFSQAHPEYYESSRPFKAGLSNLIYPVSESWERMYPQTIPLYQVSWSEWFEGTWPTHPVRLAEKLRLTPVSEWPPELFQSDHHPHQPNLSLLRDHAPELGHQAPWERLIEEGFSEVVSRLLTYLPLYHWRTASQQNLFHLLVQRGDWDLFTQAVWNLEKGISEELNATLEITLWTEPDQEGFTPLQMAWLWQREEWCQQMTSLPGYRRHAWISTPSLPELGLKLGLGDGISYYFREHLPWSESDAESFLKTLWNLTPTQRPSPHLVNSWVQSKAFSYPQLWTSYLKTNPETQGWLPYLRSWAEKNPWALINATYDQKPLILAFTQTSAEWFWNLLDLAPFHQTSFWREHPIGREIYQGWEEVTPLPPSYRRGDDLFWNQLFQATTQTEDSFWSTHNLIPPPHYPSYQVASDQLIPSELRPWVQALRTRQALPNQSLEATLFRTPIGTQFLMTLALQHHPLAFEPLLNLLEAQWTSEEVVTLAQEQDWFSFFWQKSGLTALQVWVTSTERLTPLLEELDQSSRLNDWIEADQPELLSVALALGYIPPPRDYYELIYSAGATRMLLWWQTHSPDWTTRPPSPDHWSSFSPSIEYPHTFWHLIWEQNPPTWPPAPEDTWWQIPNLSLHRFLIRQECRLTPSQLRQLIRTTPPSLVQLWTTYQPELLTHRDESGRNLFWESRTPGMTQFLLNEGLSARSATREGERLLSSLITHGALVPGLQEIADYLQLSHPPLEVSLSHPHLPSPYHQLTQALRQGRSIGFPWLALIEELPEVRVPPTQPVLSDQFGRLSW